MTQVMEPREKLAAVEAEETTSHRGRGWLFALLAAALTGLIGFGVGWLVFDEGGGDVEVPAEVDELLDAYDAAWRSGDGEAVVDLMAVGGIHVTPGLGAAPATLSTDVLVDSVDFVARNEGFLYEFSDVEYVAFSGDAPPYFVVRTGLVEIEGEPSFDTFSIVDESGELKIAAHAAFNAG